MALAAATQSPSTARTAVRALKRSAVDCTNITKDPNPAALGTLMQVTPNLRGQQRLPPTRVRAAPNCRLTLDPRGCACPTYLGLAAPSSGSLHLCRGTSGREA
jgi:hypothetical protein